MITPFTIMELSIFVGSMGALIAGILKASNCKKISCGWGLMVCDRSEIDENQTEITAVPPTSQIIETLDKVQENTKNNKKDDFTKALELKV